MSQSDPIRIREVEAVATCGDARTAAIRVLARLCQELHDGQAPGAFLAQALDAVALFERTSALIRSLGGPLSEQEAERFVEGQRTVRELAARVRTEHPTLTLRHDLIHLADEEGRTDGDA